MSHKLPKDHTIITQEDCENLQFFMDHDCSKAVFKLLDRLLIIQQEEILNFNLSEKTFAHLGMIKAKADGSAELINKLRREITRLVASDTGVKNGRVRN